jgi:hypothetical protein
MVRISKLHSKLFREQVVDVSSVFQVEILIACIHSQSKMCCSQTSAVHVACTTASAHI